MKTQVRIFIFLVAALFLNACHHKEKDQTPEPNPKILVFYKTAGFYHSSIPVAIEALRKLGADNNISVDTTKVAANFTRDNLANYKAVVFLSTTGDVLNDAQQRVFEEYIRAGNGFVGVHAATDTEYDWPWYNGLVGAYFDSHPAIQPATIDVVDKNHDATAFLPDSWQRTDEWYNFKNLNPSIQVLANLNEQSYSGGIHGASHPIAWYHTYQDGRAFYTAGGHTEESYREPLFLQHLLGGIQYAMGASQRTLTPNPNPTYLWTNLLDQNLSQWDKFIGVPHYTVNIPGHPSGDGVNGIPLGLNNDPLEVFKVITENGKPVLQISGQIYGGLSTKQEFGNYHFKAEFKWGTRKYEPRLNDKRDNGILYHAKGSHGAFWNVWMLAQEMQIQETDMGDYFALGPGMDVKSSYRTVDNESAWMYDPTATLRPFGMGQPDGRCRRSHNNEKPLGQWNTVELICLGQKSIHVVNGQVVMVLENSREWKPDGSQGPLTNGKIQIQSEAAEAYYRNIQIRPITEIPAEYR
ncbi:ThuA domain-containing protein [Hymenobacter sp. 15J16-1T3B]|uniref:ThuA domain-containing protein n=1 Tax=Hymenobacter sp. 15J16-1T3B TaxID=2886941 RepID=UPI001D11B85E|nr:ThuA domain-containing protein [Hymenobacter sp. 15J16-1T3B]MCC3156988.1 ThuA domain-containing protein [Hymenobacter sp. 15J16-1T3B]